MSSESNRKIYIIGSFVSLGGFLFGYHTAVISGVTTMKNFISTFGDEESVKQGKLTSIRNGGIVISLLLGCVFGALIAGRVSDLISRKYSIVLSSVIFIMSAIIQVFSFNLPMLIVARLIAGISVGAISVVVPIYQSEIATKKIRGRLVTLQQLAITIGIAFSFWINYLCNIYFPDSDWSWRIPFVFQLIPALILGIGMNFFPSSPRWLMSRNREAFALNVLAEIRGGDPSDIQAELDGIKRELVLESENESESRLSVGDTSFVRRLILGIGIQIFSQLTGINSIMYYAPEIFKQTGLAGDKGSLLLTGISGCINVVGTIPAVIFIDKVGRRILLIVGSIVMSLSMLSIGIVMGVYGERKMNSTTGDFDVIIGNKSISYVIVVVVYIFVGGFAVSCGPIQWVYCSEIFPLSKRSTGASITTTAHWIANVGVSFVVPILLEKIWFIVYIIFGIFCALMSILTFLFYPETKGVPLERMNKLFRGPICVVSRSNREELIGILDQDDDPI